MPLTALSKAVSDHDKVKEPPERLPSLQAGISMIEAGLRKSEAFRCHVAEIEERQQTPSEAKVPDPAPSTPKEEEIASAGFPEAQEGHELCCSNPFQAKPSDASANAFASMLNASGFKRTIPDLKLLHEPGPDDDQD